MSWLRASSLERRLIRLILLASTLALLCVMVGVVVYESNSFQPRALAQLRQPADVLKELLEPALDFNAREDVDRYLKTYCENQANPLVAVVYDDEGNLFASYPANLAGAPNSPALPGHKFSAGTLVLWEQLARQDQILGHLYLREQLPPLYARLAQYSLMLGTLLTALIIVGGTLLLGTRRYILRPLAGLVKTTEHIAHYNDFSVRSTLQQDDEVGHLARTFNRMLDVISASDASLRESKVRLASVNQELETRVAQRTAELEASNKELESFNYSVSHDLRAPLRHVAGFIELLKGQGYANADQKSQHYMDVISASAVQMGNMVDDILAFSRLGRVEMRMSKVSLDELVKAALTILQPEMTGREICWNISPLPRVEGERDMLQRVMTNLISNALKYSRPKAQVVIEISVKTHGDEHIICIKDNGVGFDMRYVDKLFGVFQRLHRADEFEGTGIGLANVQRIIQRHGGRVWAEGKLGEGASFYFSLKSTSNLSENAKSISQ